MLLAMNFIFTVACLYISTNLHSRLISNERFEVKIYVFLYSAWAYTYYTITLQMWSIVVRTICLVA